MTIYPMLDKLFFYLDFPFVRYAIIVGTLISLCSSLLGVTLVLKRYSYIGDGLSHVAFGALAIAAVLKVTNNMLIILPVTIVVAILLLCGGKDARIKGDAAIAMVSAGALAIGYLLMNIFSSSANIAGDVCTTLFGSMSILTLKPTDVYLCVGLSAIVLVTFVLFYHKIFAITFDENFARATGVNVNFFNLLIYRPCHESRRSFARFGARCFPRAFSHASFQKLFHGNNCRSHNFCNQLTYRNHRRHPCRDSCGFNNCRSRHSRIPHLLHCKYPS